MRIAVAKYGQETSSFSKTKTTLQTFEKFGLLHGDEMLKRGFDVGVLAGFKQSLADNHQEWTVVPLIRGWAGASGVIEDSTFAHILDTITDGLRHCGNIDALFLDLHGAGETESEPDSEGFLLERCREILGDECPILLALDHHANITARMVRNCNALVAHQTQPHLPYETGYECGKVMLRILREGIEPVTAFRKIPLITHQEQYLTAPPGPMREWFELAREMETREGVIGTSTFPMQPWLDVPEGGWSVTVTTNGNRQQAEDLATELATFAWDNRDRFLTLESVPVQEAVRRAVDAQDGLIILSDTGDSVFGGAPGDSTIILTELLAQDVQQVALVPMNDAKVVDIAIQAGIGAEIDVHIGGKQDDNYSSPLQINATVMAIGGGEIAADVIGMNSFNAGRAVHLRTGNVHIVVSESEGIGGNHPAVYEHFGIDVSAAKMVVLKTASNFQYYKDWTAEIIRVNTEGMTMSKIDGFNWKHLPRPIYPLNPETTYDPGSDALYCHD